jgi:hypothetical protein
MEETKQKRRAQGTDNGDFLAVSTRSGNAGVHRLDPLGNDYLLAPNVSEEDLGNAVLDALAHSCFLEYKEHPGWYDSEDAKKQNDERVATLMTRYGYKKRSSLFSSMELCAIELVEGVITIRPNKHVKSEVWEQRTPDLDKNLTIAADSPPAEIGAALKEGFRRCRG